MRILVFGAAGNVGGRVISEARQRGHDVTAVLRDAARAPRSLADATIIAGNAADPGDVARLSADQDVVISATRPQPGSEHEHPNIAKSLLEGLRLTDTRLILVGGAGSLIAPDTGSAIVDDPRYVAPAWRCIAVACCEQYAVCREETHTDWTYLSPPALLQPGKRTGHYRKGTDQLLLDDQGMSQISMEDLAVALIDEAEEPTHRRARFTVAY